MFEMVQPLDTAVWVFFQTHQIPIVTKIVNVLTEFGHPLFWIIVAAVLYWWGREQNSFWLSTTILVTSGVIGFAKISFDRVRPLGGTQGILSGLSNESTNDSFPSGHAGTIGAVNSFWNQNGDNLIRAGVLVLVVLVSLSRLYLGAHFVSDVLAGLLIGSIVAGLLNRLRVWVNEKHFQLSKRFELLLLLVAALALEALGGEWRLLLYFAGFYMGIIGWEKIKPTKRSPINGVKVLVGLVGMGLLLSVYQFTRIEIWSGALVLVAGLWVTLLFPLLWHWTANLGQRA